ncbi:MAG: PhoH family protein, partial [Myxococcales bacterium]|nr:PhoH family protein [Myxococcales bacterium]
MATDESSPADDSPSYDFDVEDRGVLLRLTGPGSAHLRLLEKELGVQLGLRGSTIRIQGEADRVALARRVLGELAGVLRRGKDMTELEIVRAARTLEAHPSVKLSELFGDVVVVASRQRIVAPKSVAQRAYIQAIREKDVVFGIGPAGTGKTYLAMAMAVHALQAKQVKRIILTRPAVEA